MQRLLNRRHPWYAGGRSNSILEWATPTAVAVAFAAGAAFGAALMYLLDPDRGRRRRALIRDQMVHAGHELGDLGEDTRGRAQDLRNRAQGAVAETRRAAVNLAGSPD